MVAVLVSTAKTGRSGLAIPCHTRRVPGADAGAERLPKFPDALGTTERTVKSRWLVNGRNQLCFTVLDDSMALPGFADRPA